MGIEMHSHPDPDGLGHSLPLWAAGHYCKKHMLESIFTFDFAQRASPPLRHSGQLMSKTRCCRCSAGNHLRRTGSHHLPPRPAWLDMDARDPLPGPQRPETKKNTMPQGSTPVRASVDRSPASC
jgi:hypothetical protein